jgi:alkylated DNA repair dioxygenase AlkB
MQQIVTEHEHIGLRLYAEFITADEEQSLIARFSAGAPKNVQPSDTNRPSIRRYGSDKSYNSYMQADTIPVYLQALCDRLLENKLVSVLPDSVSINEYLKGQRIAPHIDNTASGRIVTVLSVESPATMIFLRDQARFSVALPPRSLVQIHGEIRNDWKHAIEPVTNRRYSLVFRCSCDGYALESPCLNS